MSSAPQFWCHACTKLIRPSEEFLCPECRGDFIEMLEEDSANFVSYDNTPSQSMHSSFQPPMSATQISPTPVPNQTIHDPFSQLLSQLSSAFAPRRIPYRSNSLPSTSNSVNNSSQLSPNPSVTFSPNTTTANFVIHTNVDRNARLPHPFFGSQVASINQMFNHAFGIRSINPGDYSWGRNFEDLLNHLFHSGGRPGNPPASQSALDQLPKLSIQQQHLDDGLDCTICKDEFKLNELVTQLPCSHIFHSECVTTWLKIHNQCPVCRYELPTEDKEYEERRRTSYGCPSSNRRCHRQ